MTKSRKIRNRILLGAMSVALFGLPATTAQAWEFSNGEWTGSIDTTISYGAAWRLKDYDPSLVGKQANDPLTFTYPKSEWANTVGRWSANGDDGNLNYRDSGDLISHAVKATVEFDVRWRNYGGFARVTGFYDFENHNKDGLSDLAQKRTGKEARLLDAYIYGNNELGSHFLNWRIGKQVVSWGESTFIQGGINVINPVDLSKLRVAGAELKEAFEGVNMLSGSIDLTPSVSLEALYMFEYRNIRPDPAGTYFSTNDIGSPGALPTRCWVLFTHSLWSIRISLERFANKEISVHLTRRCLQFWLARVVGLPYPGLRRLSPRIVDNTVRP